VLLALLVLSGLIAKRLLEHAGQRLDDDMARVLAQRL